MVTHPSTVGPSMSPRSIPSLGILLPQEIHDEIIDFLPDDHDALQSCAVVCRAWLPRARRHLFRSLTLDPSPRSCHFVKLAQSCPDIQPLVRDLELRGRTATSMAWWEGAQRTVIPWPTLATLPGNVPHPDSLRREPDAVEVLSWMRLTFAPADRGGPALLNLPKIHTLRLSETTLNTESAVFLGEVFPHVQTLTLNQCRVMSFAGLATLFQAFPRLRTLRLLAVDWLRHRVGAPLPDTTPGSLSNLTTLDISRDFHVDTLVDWLLQVLAHKTIRRLSCSISTWSCAKAMRTFLNASGGSLEHLSITLAQTWDPTAILEGTQLDLAPCTGLQSLHVSCSPGPGELSSRSLSWVLILLSKVRSPQLEEIRISIASPELALLNLEGLDVVLAHNDLRGMRALTFDVDDTKATSRRGIEEIETLLKQRVPTASAQHLVRLEYRC